jgi:hypothetical protein
VVNQNFAVFFVLLVFGCGYPERPKIITLSSAASFRPSSPTEIKSIEQALAAIVTVCRDDLKLPVVQSFEAKLYRNSQSFATFGVDWRAFPVDVANMTAFADGTKIHIDLQKAHDDSGWALLTWLLAHEYGHTIHHEIAGVIPQTDPWLNEGFAEWVAAKTLDALGWQDYRLSIHRVEREAARYLDLLPKLGALRNRQVWDRTRGFTYGRIRTYSLALLAVDRLIQRKKLASAVPLLSANVFNESFGGFYDNLHREILTDLTQEKRQLDADELYSHARWEPVIDGHTSLGVLDRT